MYIELLVCLYVCMYVYMYLFVYAVRMYTEAVCI